MGIIEQSTKLAKKSHLYEFHKNNGKLTEFSGFEMPLWYTSIIDEHMAVRKAAGLFDVSHMGRIWISGRGATEFMSRLLPTDPTKIKDGRAFYSTILNNNGGIVDDVIVNKFSTDRSLMVVNAGNRSKDFGWMEEQSRTFDVSLENISDSSALLAFQGPLASEILQEITDAGLDTLRRFGFIECQVAGERSLVSRTGYTGEDGFEITVFDTPVETPGKAVRVWNEILERGRGRGVVPCGLGARDSLRLEAGMCLYGQDIDDTTTPVEASLEFVITQHGYDYVGKSVIESQVKDGTERKRIAFSMVDSGIPRHGYPLTISSSNVGTVTSGTFSPVLKKGIGMGYVKTPLSSIGQGISVDIRASSKGAVVTSTPFYDTDEYGYKRRKVAA